MIIKSVNLETVCGYTSKLPENDKYEIAFAGRSNVGKSTLINALINRKAYARTSSKPGKTQTINFYNINDEVYYVDLPGYGYATAGKDEIAKWGTMIENYLNKSDMLRMVFLLVDCRHVPNANDIQMYDWCIHYGFNPVIIATKFDKLKRSEYKQKINAIRTALKTDEDTPVVPFSALSKVGIDEINEYIDIVMNMDLEEHDE